MPFDLLQAQFATSNPLHVGTTLIVLCLALAILIRERGSVVARAYGVYCLAVLAWLVGLIAVFTFTDPDAFLLLAAVVLPITSLIGPAIYHFATLAAERPSHARLKLLLAWSSSLAFAAGFWVPGLFVDGVLYYPWGIYPSFTAFAAIWIGHQLLLVAFSMALFWRVIRDPERGALQRRRCRLLLGGLCLGLFSSLDVLATFGIGLPPVSPWAIPVYLTTVTYVAWRYRLVNITPELTARHVLATMSEPLLVVDDDGIVRLANPAAARLFRKSAAHGEKLTQVLGDPRLIKQVRRCLTPGGPLTAQAPYRSNTGTEFTLRLAVAPIAPNRGVGAYICVFTDVTASATAATAQAQLTKQLQETLQALAQANGRLRSSNLRDPLTGVFKRRYVEDSLIQMWQLARQQGGFLSVLAVQLERLELINRQLGRARGDAALREVAIVLQEALELPGQVIGRFGGGRFVVALPDTDARVAYSLAKQAQAKVAALNFSHDAEQTPLAVSVGIATTTPASDLGSPHNLLHSASAALRGAERAAADEHHPAALG